MRNITFIVMLVSVSFNSYAQIFRGGIIAGLTTSQLDGDTYSGYHRAGLNAGGYVGFDLSKKSAWQLEMKFVQKGSYKKQNPDANDFKIYRSRLNYVEMPLLLEYKYKPKITFEAGFCFGYLAGTKEKDEIGTLVSQKPFHKFEVSYQIGGYYQLLKQLSFNIRYSYSLLPIRQNVVGQRRILFQWGQFNNVLSFSFYYQFNKPDE